jgi:GT2 family glycosyltransferase
VFYSIVIATHNRLSLLKECIESIVKSDFDDYEVIIAHSGIQEGTEEFIKTCPSHFKYLKCKEKGAAKQRNEGVEIAVGKWIVFLDDDVEIQTDFLSKLYTCHLANPQAKGISGSIVNQYYSELSPTTKKVLKICGVDTNVRIDGKVLGPALNFLPRQEGADVEPIDWMPTCVCSYEKDILIELGVFPSQFVGYSYGEDLYLSLLVSQKHPVLLCRKAKLYHKDIGSTSHKNHFDIAVMQVDNRNYINNKILKKNRLKFNFQLLIWNNYNAFAQLKYNKSFAIYFQNVCGFYLAFLKNIFTSR